MNLFPIYSGTLPHRRFGFMNETGTVVIPPQYAGAGEFSEGLAVVSVAGKAGFINEVNQIVIEARHERASAFRNGFSHCVSGSGHIYVDKHGKVVLRHKFRESDDVGEGHVPVTRSICDHALLTLEGKVVIDHSFSQLEVAEGKIACRAEAGRHAGAYGYKCNRDEWVIEPQYLLAWPFSEGLAAVQVQPKGTRREMVQFIDATNRVIIPAASYTTVDGRFRCGRARVWKPVKRNELAGFLDRAGNEVVPCRFDVVEDFSGERAAVKKGDRWGYVGLAGEEVIRPRFDFAGPFRGGLAQVVEEGCPAYIDKGGNIIWSGEERVYAKGKPLILAWASNL